MPTTVSIIKMVKLVALAFLPVCLLAGLLVFSPIGHGQTPVATPPPSKGQDEPDVLRVYTQLVQTDVMVFDKQGHFVNDLKIGDFELRIDGQLKPIEFFEKITAGSRNEEVQLAAARGSAGRKEDSKVAAPAPLDRGRPIFFYVDDLHLNAGSMAATRKLIAHFIDSDMGQNDEAAISSASGQIGFLQQLTDNKAVLRAALDRLKFRSHNLQSFERPPMTEYQAVLIGHRDRDITEYFIEQTLRENPGLTPQAAANLVDVRARALAMEGGSLTKNTLLGLEDLVRSANKVPGRKLVFFISGGFLVDDLESNSRNQLQQITSAAARSGVVIYSLDARGLVSGLPDASSQSQPDATGRLLRAGLGEILATQDAMNALANDTGGKATFNTNALEPAVSRALQGSSTYYLLAWKPEAEPQLTSKFRRIEVKVVGKPNLMVQVRRGFFDREPPRTEAKAKEAKTEKNEAGKKPGETKAPESELQKAILAAYPGRDIPVFLSLTYTNTPAKGPMLSTALQSPNEFFSFVPVNGKYVAEVSVAGIVFDDNGKTGATFHNRIKIDAASADVGRAGPDLTYGYPVYVKPGLYQVRVGVRDEGSGRSGTAHGWIEIPNLSTGKLALSSLLVGERKQAANKGTSAPAAELPLELSLTHNFSANGSLRFLVIVYNAARAGSQPDVAIQVQVVRDQQPVVSAPLKKISVDDLLDPARIPYAAEIPLGGLPAGSYVLQVTVVDRVTKQSATQETRFEIE